MATFSEQLKAQQLARTQIEVSKLPRTQRKQYQIVKKEAEIKSAQELERRKGMFEEAQKKVSTMSLAEYKLYYPQMEDWLKGMFTAPEVIEQKQTEAIQTNVSKGNEQIKKYQDKIIQRQKDIEEYQRWYQNLSSKSRASRKENYKERIKDYEKDIEEYNYYVDYWNNAMGYLNQGIDYGNVQDWVASNVDYKVAKSEAKARAKAEAEKRTAEINKLVSQGYSPMLIEEIGKKGVTEKAKITFYNPKASTPYIDITGLELQQASVKGLQPSALGIQQTQMKFDFGGKQFYISPTQQVYKTTKGELITSLTGGMGIKEEDILKTSQEIAVKSTQPENIWVLQEAKKISEPTKKEEGSINKIISKVSSSVGKVRKWGIAQPFTIMGVPIEKIKTKKNPSLPPVPTDRLTTIKPTLQEIKNPNMAKTFVGGAGKFLASAYTNVPVALYKDIAQKFKKEETKVSDIPPQMVSTPKDMGKSLATTSAETQLEPPSPEVLAKDYRLVTNPQTQEIYYIPKGKPLNEVMEKPEGFVPVEKLAVSIPKEKGEVTTLKAFGIAEEIPAGYQRISPTTLEPVYAKEGRTAEEQYKFVKEQRAKAPVWKKPLVALTPKLTWADPLALKSTAIKVGGILGVATKGKVGYTFEETEKKLADIEKSAFTKYAYGETGEKLVSPVSFSLKSPVSQTALVYGGSMLAGSTIASVGGILPTKVGTALSSKAVVLGGQAVMGTLVGYQAGKTIIKLKEAKAPPEEYVGQLGTQAVFLGAGIKGFQAGLKAPLPLRLGKVSYQEVIPREFVTKKVGGEKIQVPKTKEVYVWKGAYLEPKAHEVKVLLGRTKVPEAVTGFGEAIGKYQTKWTWGVPKKFAYPKQIFDVTGATKGGYIPSTPVETEFYKQYVGRYGTLPQQRLVSSALAVRRGTEFVKVKPVGFEEFKRVEAIKGLNAEGKKALLEWMKAQKGDYMVYGSSTVPARAGEGVLKRPVHDIDMQFTYYSGQEKAKELYEILKATGSRVRIDPTSKTQIMVSIKGKPTKLMDIHGYDAPEITPDQLFGFRYQTPTKVPIGTGEGKGIKAMPLSQQATQKLAGTLTLRKTPSGKIYFGAEDVASPKFMESMKHPFDLYNIEKFQIEHLSPVKKLLYAQTLRKQLEVFKEAGIMEFGAKTFAEKEGVILLGGRITQPSAPSYALSPTAFAPSLTPSRAVQTEVSKAIGIEISKAIQSPSISTGVSVSISPSISPKVSVSPSVSPSVSVSPSPSPSVSPSVSVSPSPSPSVSVSPSPSPSVSVSPSPSPYPSPSPSISPSPPPPPPVPFGLVLGGGVEKARTKKLKKAIEEKVYAPSLTAKIVQEAPILITETQAQKLLSTKFTGFEYRPAVSIIKGTPKSYKKQKSYSIPKNILSPKIAGIKTKIQKQRKNNVRTKIKTTKINFNPKVKTNTLF